MRWSRAKPNRRQGRAYFGSMGQGASWELSFDGLEVMTDTSPADWVLERLRPWRRGRLQVASLVPDGYEAYGRILHPARRSDKPGRSRWATIGEERGIAIGPEVRFTALVGWVPARDGQDPPAPYHAPACGTLRTEECARLAQLLARFTSTPEKCWFCLWEGYGWPELPPPGQGPPRAHLPYRDCILFSAPSSERLPSVHHHGSSRPPFGGPTTELGASPARSRGTPPTLPPPVRAWTHWRRRMGSN